MARFPKIQRNCPYKDSLTDIMDGDHCRHCRRQVHDLDRMGERERKTFLESRSEEVCVSYSLPRRSGAAALTLSAAMLASLPVAAQDAVTDDFCDDEAVEDRELWVSSDNQSASIEDYEEFIIVVGGIKDFTELEYVDDSDDLDIPELPVSYEGDDV